MKAARTTIIHFPLFLSLIMFNLALRLSAQSVPNCDASQIDCSLKQDTRNCKVRRCAGIDWGGCHGQWVEFNDPVCETSKAAQNRIYEADKAACELRKTATKSACQLVQASSDATSSATAVLDHVVGEVTEAGMRILPKQVSEGVIHLTKELRQEIDNYPILATYLNAEYKIVDPIGSRVIDRLTGMHCNPGHVVTKLSSAPQRTLDGPSKNLGVLTSSIKQIGVSGWTPTGCVGQGQGVLVADPAHSSDQFWTIDVSLISFIVSGSDAAPANKYLRLEVEKNMPANAYVTNSALKKGDTIIFRGPILFDNDPPRWLEVHPIDVLAKTSDLSPSIQTALTAKPQPKKDGWLYIGRAASDTVWASGSPSNVEKVTLPIKIGDILTLTATVTIRAANKTHSSGAAVDTLVAGQKIKVIDLDRSHALAGGHYIWVKVAVVAA